MKIKTFYLYLTNPPGFPGSYTVYITLFMHPPEVGHHSVSLSILQWVSGSGSLLNCMNFGAIVWWNTLLSLDILLSSGKLFPCSRHLHDFVKLNQGTNKS